MSLFLEGKRLGVPARSTWAWPRSPRSASCPVHTCASGWPGCSSSAGSSGYNFQGLRRATEKFDPEWVPRVWRIQSAWEWPMAIAHVSALIAGSWSSVVMPGRSAGAAVDATPVMNRESVLRACGAQRQAPPFDATQATAEITPYVRRVSRRRSGSVLSRSPALTDECQPEGLNENQR